MSILDSNITLVLNANWIAIGCITPKKAMISMCSESGGQKAAMGMDIVTELDADGNPSLVHANPVLWEDWIALPIRDGDLSVQTANRAIRIPTVIICCYTKVPRKKPRLSKAAIMKRDGYQCQYTGETLPISALNIDHIYPLDRGGRNTWENMVTSRRDINFKKGNRLNSEVGLKLIRQPKAPPEMPVIIRPEDAAHQTWLPFLIK